MAQTKQKAVFIVESAQLEAIRKVVRSGRYRSTSEFLREAVDEKLQRIRRERLASQLEKYCTETYANEGCDCVAFQAFDRDKS